MTGDRGPDDDQIEALKTALAEAEARHQIDLLMITQLQQELHAAIATLDDLERQKDPLQPRQDRSRGAWWYRLLLSPKTRRQIRILEDCEEFDGYWYLETYQDLATLSMPAAYHYLKFGACEYRDPSPYFSTQRYAWLHPDLDFSETNPLIHHLANSQQ